MVALGLGIRKKNIYPFYVGNFPTPGRKGSCTRFLAIVEAFENRDVLATPAVPGANHGPFCWGSDGLEAVHTAVVLEEVAKMGYLCEHVQPAPQHLQEKQ